MSCPISHRRSSVSLAPFDSLAPPQASSWDIAALLRHVLFVSFHYEVMGSHDLRFVLRGVANNTSVEILGIGSFDEKLRRFVLDCSSSAASLHWDASLFVVGSLDPVIVAAQVSPRVLAAVHRGLPVVSRALALFEDEDERVVGRVECSAVLQGASDLLCVESQLLRARTELEAGERIAGTDGLLAGVLSPVTNSSLLFSATLPLRSDRGARYRGLWTSRVTCSDDHDVERPCPLEMTVMLERSVTEQAGDADDLHVVITPVS